MSDKRQETIADIVAEMRKDIAEGTVGIWSDFGGEIARGYADRIEAAWKREVETTTDESSAVGNANAVRGIAQEMLNTSMQDTTAERINGWAMRLAEACEQPVTDCNQLGNTAKMREALEQADAVLSLISKSAWFIDANFSVIKAVIEAFNAINAALSAPPRNCEVGTADEQVRRHLEWCERNAYKCQSTPSCAVCLAEWAQMPYEEGGAK